MSVMLEEAETSRSAVRDLLDEQGWFLHQGKPLSPSELRRTVLRFGTPVAPDGITDIWPVTPRKAEGGATFSETAAAADAHTDSQYATLPEPAFLLHCIRPACDGGVNLLWDAAAILQNLKDNAFSAFRLLSTIDVPFAAPPTFPNHTIGWGRIISDTGVRWRRDTLSEGLRCTGIQIPHLHTAIDDFETALGDTNPTEIALDAGDTLYVDNRKVLHGRTAFTDPERFLYRVRWTW